MTLRGIARIPCGREVFSDAEWEAIGEMHGLEPAYVAIVKGIFDDHTNRRMAADLRVSVHAIDMRLRHLYMHLQVHSRPQLIVKILATYKTMHVK